jgi:hypothetical protein
LRDDVRRDLSDSAYDFLRVVWPKIEPFCAGGRLEPIESTTSRRRIDHDLDILAGIDAWHMLDSKGVMRGIASRVQWGPKNWRTFTIRESRPNGSATEFAKRLYALDHLDQGWLFPSLTIQAYVTQKRTGCLLGAAIIHTSDLFKYARAPSTPQRRRRASNGGEGFLHYGWADLRKAGYHIGEVTGDLVVSSLADWPKGTSIQEGLF